MTFRYLIIILSLKLATCISQGSYEIQVLDPSFAKFLRENYVEVIDSNNGNIIVSKASAIAGTLNASGYGIKNVDGIQAFANITVLDLHDNNIEELPALTSFKSLKVLNISQNKIDSIPNLDSNLQLEELTASENKLKFLPSVNGIKLLRVLDLENNQILELPEVSDLDSLNILNINNNLISKIPNISTCKKLKILKAGHNKIIESPIIDSLRELTTIDLSHNALYSMPNFENNIKLEQIFIENNNISYFNNFPMLPNLENVRLYGNKLTFSSLTKLIKIDNYKTIFDLTPQANTYSVQYRNKVRADTLNITTGIDSYTENVYYRWYKDNIYYKTCNYDYFTVPNLSLTDSGAYFCEVRHDSFPDIYYNSDIYKLRVENCMEINDFDISISPEECDIQGKLSIKSEQNVNNRYVLASDNYNLVDTSTTGQFKDLKEGRYTLEIIDPKGCSVNYPHNIYVPGKSCTYPLITPNDDGDEDSYFFEQTGEVRIYDKQGNMIKSVQIPGSWDATSKYGRVRTGLYTADINRGSKIIKISVVY